MSGWIGVDLDGTLAHYDGWRGITHIGPPVPKMLARVKQWISEGREVKIFTARMSTPSRRQKAEFLKVLHEWCVLSGLPELEATCIKDFGMRELYDDRAVQVECNTGELVGKSTRGLE